MSTETPVETLTYEQAFAELEEVVAALENSQRPLDETMALFERGQLLIQRCTSLLENAEIKVRLITGEALDDSSSAS